jgi:probable HAF family extracellular repeat protein
MATLFAMLALAAAAHAAPRYTIHGLGAGPLSSANSVNSAGAVVGSKLVGTGARAFVWRPRTGLRFLPSLHGATFAHDINDRGDIVGISGLDAIMWRNDGRIFRVPAGIQSDDPCGVVMYVAHLINDARLIAGSGSSACAPDAGVYTWNAAGATACHTDTCSNFTSLALGVARGLDEHGTLVGVTSFLTDPMSVAFMYRDGAFTYLDLLTNIPGVSIGEANAINRSGSVIVGTSSTANYENHAVTWTAPNRTVHDLTPHLGAPWDQSAADAVNDGGTVLLSLYDQQTGRFMHVLRTPDGHRFPLDGLITNRGAWSSITPTAINNRGVIVGEAVRNGTSRAVILTPAG